MRSHHGGREPNANLPAYGLRMAGPGWTGLCMAGAIPTGLKVMAKRQFHLAWFLSQGFGPKNWRSMWPGADVARWMTPDLFVDLARGMERACFDYMIIEDSSMLPYTYQGSHDVYLRHAAATPKLKPREAPPKPALAVTSSKVPSP